MQLIFLSISKTKSTFKYDYFCSFLTCPKNWLELRIFTKTRLYSQKINLKKFHESLILHIGYTVCLTFFILHPIDSHCKLHVLCVILWSNKPNHFSCIKVKFLYQKLLVFLTLSILSQILNLIWILSNLNVLKFECQNTLFHI